MSAAFDAMTAIELRDRIARREVSPVEVTRRALDKAQATQPSLNAFFLLVDEPEAYGLPREPKMPSRNLVRSSLLSTIGAVAMTFIGALGLRARRMKDVADSNASEKE